MSALVSYNSHGFSNPNFFRAHKGKNNNYYDQYFMEQHLSIPRPFPTLPYYQSHPFQLDQYSLGNYKRLERFHTNANLTNFHQADIQYRYAQYIRHLDESHKRRSKQEAAVPTGSLQTTNTDWYYTNGVWHQFEKETRFVPYPVYIGGNNLGFNVTRNLPYEYRTTLGFGSVINSPLESFVNWNLPPKIRVIFMPMDPTPIQPSFTNALAMPPFLFNRMAQPLCALPLPPPLPNIASLCLPPTVQQMVAQQYANPVATLPFTPNYQMPQPILPAYPQYAQPQQQPYTSASSLQSSEYASPAYIPPTLLPADMPLLPSNTAFSPYSADASRPQLPWSNSAHANTCRACVPAPPSLNIPVSGHYWMQHCSACHHVPADATYSNSRSSNGRFTPLLRHPIVQQYTHSTPRQLQQQQYYPSINTSVLNHRWAHLLPPLPPGAVLISDEYLPIRNIPQTVQFSQIYPMNYPRVYKSLSRSVVASTDNYTHDKKRKKKSKRKKQKKFQKEQSQIICTNNSVTSSSSSSSSTSSKTRRSSGSSSCSLCKAMNAHEISKSTSSSYDIKQSVAVAQKELTPAAQSVKLQYTFQPIDLQSVYKNNLLLKSSDTDTVSLSSSNISTKSFLNNQDIMENLQRSMIKINVIKEAKEEEEEEEKKENEQYHDEENKFVPLSFPILPTLQRPRKTVFIIQEYSSSSPSIISLVSSNLSFNKKKKESDAVSTTSTIKEFNETNENTETLDL